MGTRARGFTLIELMVALAIALAVTSSALSVLLLVVQTQREGILRNELARDAQFATDVLTRDLHYLGAGVPRGFRADKDGNVYDSSGAAVGLTSTTSGAVFQAAAAKQLRPVVRYGTSKALAFLGDLPFANAELNGVASINDVWRVSDHPTKTWRIHVSSELSPCGATEPGYECGVINSGFLSLADIGGDQDCWISGSTMKTNEPRCPWGLGKWQRWGSTPGVDLILTALDGSWYPRRWKQGTDVGTGSGSAASFGQGCSHTSSGDIHERRAWVNLGSDSASSNALPHALFVGTGTGLVANIDRVFYSVEPASAACSVDAPCTLYRRQCWAFPQVDASAAGPSDATFPGVGAAPLTSSSAPMQCNDAADEGTPWERVLGNISSFSFRYYGPDDFTTDLATLDAEKAAKTRSLEFDFVVERYAPGSSTRTVKQRVRRRVWLENGGGLVTTPSRTPEISGGCMQDPEYPNECNPL